MKKITSICASIFFLIVASCGSLGGTVDSSSVWTKLSNVVGSGGIAVDSSGNSYVIGSTTVALDGELLTGSMDALLMKYNSSGVKQWTKLLGVAGVNTEAKGIAVDVEGNIYRKFPLSSGGIILQHFEIVREFIKPAKTRRSES